MTIQIELPIAPVAKGRPRFGRKGAYTPNKTRAFENDLQLYAKKAYKGEPLNTPLKVVVEFHLEKPRRPKHTLPAVRPDLDNYIKAVMDAGNDIFWVDDGLICSITGTKVYSIGRPKIVLFIEEI